MRVIAIKRNEQWGYYFGTADGSYRFLFSCTDPARAVHVHWSGVWGLCDL
ncbi:hypothetical protein Acsp03_72300 [Actinomadura sp. NBRC 104412]|nr:hypothetical protein Acsp03_72300 [Actinomadura sp. NBRC 104412]